MPLSHFRRPLFLLALGYLVLLCLLRDRLGQSPQEAFLKYRFHSRVSLRGLVVSPMKRDRRGSRLIVHAESLAGEPFRQRVLVYLQGAEPPLPGQRVLLDGRLRLPRSARNPGEFDERKLLAERGVAWIFRAESAWVGSQAVPWSWKPWFWAEQARRSMEQALEQVLPVEQAGLAAGLALGYKGPLPASVNRFIQDAGVMHLLVPSGAKVGFVMLGVLWCLLKLGLPPIPRFLGTALVGGFYTLMVGGEAPYARAYLGGLALLGAGLLDRMPDSFQAMTLSAFLILIYEPRQLFTAGFQMTYLAVFGLVVGMPRFNAFVPRAWPKWLKRLAGVAAVSLIVQLMLWPVFAQVFGRGSVVGFLANLVLVPASGFFMAGCFLVWLLSSWPAAAEAAGGALSRLLHFFFETCRFFAGLPGAAVDLSPMSAAAVAAYFLAVFALLLLPEKRLSAALLSVAVLIWTGMGLKRAWGAPALKLVILSLPAGRPTLLSFAGRRCWLIDPAGPPGDILQSLRHYGVRRVEKVVLAGGGNPGSLRRFEEAFGAGEAASMPGLRVCQDGVCAEFGGRWGPRLFRGDAEYSIIASRLKTSAVEVAVDGGAVRLSQAR